LSYPGGASRATRIATGYLSPQAALAIRRGADAWGRSVTNVAERVAPSHLGRKAQRFDIAGIVFERGETRGDKTRADF